MILNYEATYETIVKSLSDYLVKNNLKAQILGVSGGIDSTICSILCHEVSKKTNIPLYGVSLMCSSNKGDEIGIASEVGNTFCDKYISSSIQLEFEAIEKMCFNISNISSTNISQGNIKARLRMITLYDMASKLGGIVIGTSNVTERLTGFWTIHGDDADLNIIGGLWKTEVYGLANYLLSKYETELKFAKDGDRIKFINSAINILKKSIAIVPTDGNGVSSSDAEQIMPGYTYFEIDDVLKKWDSLSPKIKEIYAKDKLTNSIKNTIFDNETSDSVAKRKKIAELSNKEFIPTLGDKYGVECVRNVINRSIKTEYKRKRLEIIIDPHNGEIYGV